MAVRQTLKNSGTVASRRRMGRRVKGGSVRRGGTADASRPLSPRERVHLVQLVACGGIFVLLVAVKLLLPGRMAAFNDRLSAALEENMDVEAVFSAVGRAVTGETDAAGAWEEVYQAVFGPQQAESSLAEVSGEADLTAEETPALTSLQTDGGEGIDWASPEGGATRSSSETPEEPAAPSADQTAQAASLAYVLYSDQNLPDNVSLEQAILGFDYCTPVMGTLSSDFGYREHPVEGEERFHYGLDIAAEEGSDILCFADGTVTAVGESSSYGKYLMVDHGGGFSTLYAHCSRISVSSGEQVSRGEVIAQVGQTGIATGPHLHLELHRDGVYLNPIYYVSLP